MTKINKTSKTFKLLSALKAGETFTASTARKRFGIQNIRAEASRLRQGGYAVYANSRRAGNNTTVTVYELGMPSRRVVAAGYRALAQGL